MKTSQIKDPEAKEYIEDLFGDIKQFQDGDAISNKVAESLLDTVEDFGPDPGTDTLDAVVGRWNINIQGTAWHLAKAVAGLVVAITSKDGLSNLAAAKKALDALIGMKDLVRRLEEGEKQVCVAIANIEGGQHWRSHEDPGASLADIEAYFDKQVAAGPADLEAHLASVVKKGAVTVVLHEKAGKTYRMVL